MDADSIIVKRAKEDVDVGVEHAIELLKAGHSRLVAATLAGIVHGAIKTMRVKDGVDESVRFVLGYAHRCAAGEDPRKLAEEAFPKLLEMKKTHLFVREKDPGFEPLRAMLLDDFTKRLPDLATMASVKDPVDYVDLVRKAFAHRAHVEQIVDEQRDLSLAVVAHLEAHPQLLRVPSGMVPKLAKSAREMIAWQHERIRKGVDEIYGG